MSAPQLCSHRAVPAHCLTAKQRGASHGVKVVLNLKETIKYRGLLSAVSAHWQKSPADGITGLSIS